MKYLWIGILFGPSTDIVIREKGIKLMSSYVSQKGFIDGLDSFSIDMDSINSIPLDPSKVKYVNGEKWSRNGKSEDISIGYKNAKYLNHIYRKKKLIRSAIEWALNHKDEEVSIIVFQMHSPFIKAAIEVAKIVKKATITLIVPDLPKYMDLSAGLFKRILKRIDWISIKKYLKVIDKFVLYAEPMVDYLRIQNKKWCVIEGMYDTSMKGNCIYKAKDKTVIMYSGILDLNYGIPELLDSFDLLDNKYELWITGLGNAEDLIRKRAMSDKRIKFYGYLSSRQELLDYQASADVLISTRNNKLVSSRYCFPSKLFEYLASGNIVISCYLDGIPSEYHNYLIELKEVSKESIAASIKKAASLSDADRDNLKRKEIAFIENEKNKIAVSKRLLDFVNER